MKTVLIAVKRIVLFPTGMKKILRANRFLGRGHQRFGICKALSQRFQTSFAATQRYQDHHRIIGIASPFSSTRSSAIGFA